LLPVPALLLLLPPLLPGDGVGVPELPPMAWTGIDAEMSSSVAAVTKDMKPCPIITMLSLYPFDAGSGDECSLTQ
jgi:hypothetical protein